MGFWRIASKDLLILVRDRQAVVVLLVLPLLFIAVLGLSTGKLMNWQRQNQILNVSVVDLDNSELSRQLVTALGEQRGLQLNPAETVDAARLQIDARTSQIAVVIGPQFDERVERLRLRDVVDTVSGPLSAGLAALDIAVLHKQGGGSAAAILDELLLSSTLKTIVPHVARKNRLAARVLDRPAATEDAEASRASPPAEQGRFGEDYNVYQELVPAYTVMFVFFLIHLMGRSFLTERRLGTLRRLQVAPVGPGTMMIGKTVPFFLISLVQSVLLFLAGKVAFGMSWGEDPWLLIPVIVCTSLAATALGLLVATLVETDSQSSAYSNFLVITMAGISGCFIPRDWLPPLMLEMSYATPHAWALMAYDEILTREHTDIMRVMRSCAVLLGFASVYFSLGWLRFRRLD